MWVFFPRPYSCISVGALVRAYQRCVLSSAYQRYVQIGCADSLGLLAAHRGLCDISSRLCAMRREVVLFPVRCQESLAQDQHQKKGKIGDLPVASVIAGQLPSDLRHRRSASAAAHWRVLCSGGPRVAASPRPEVQKRRSSTCWPRPNHMASGYRPRSAHSLSATLVASAPARQ